jgi:hypothetical protein
MTTIIECRPPVAEKPAEGHQDQAKMRQPDQGRDARKVMRANLE